MLVDLKKWPWSNNIDTNVRGSQNTKLKILRDQLNKAYSKGNILTIVRLSKSDNENKVKLMYDGKGH